jgi:cold shock CspA family protein
MEGEKIIGEDSTNKLILWSVFGVIFIILIAIVFLFIFLNKGAEDIEISNSEVANGKTIELIEDQKVLFEIDDEEHSLEVNSVRENSVRITIWSSPITLTLTRGEEKKFDLDDDGVYDLKVKLVSLDEEGADFEIKEIDEVIVGEVELESCIENWNCGEWNECVDSNQTRTCSDLNNCGGEDGKPEEEQGCVKIINQQEPDFTECVTSDSMESYIDTSFDEMSFYKSWEFEEGKSALNYTGEIETNLQSNFPNVNLFYTIYLLGGGDFGKFNFLQSGESYCKLNSENVKKLFAPINTVEEVKEYYLFDKNLGGAWSYDMKIIFDEEDFLEAFATGEENGMECSEEDKQTLEEIYTQISENNEGFLLEIISFTHIGEGGFFKSTIQVSTQGDIEEKESTEKISSSCSFPMIVY